MNGTRRSYLYFYCLLITCAWLRSDPSNGAQDGDRPGSHVQELALSPFERALIAQQLASERNKVRVVLLATEGAADRVDTAVRKVGGEVFMREDDVGFLRAWVPIRELSIFLKTPGIETVEIEPNADWLAWPRAVTHPVSPNGAVSPAIRVDPSRYSDEPSPHFGEAATEAFQFKKLHPTYDGRGVTIGTYEPSGPDLPSLKWARTLQGERVPKFVDYLAIAPRPGVLVPALPTSDMERSLEEWSNAWQETGEVQLGQDGSIDFGGHRILPPIDRPGGELRVAFMRIKFGEQRSTLPILWAIRTGQVWIGDANSTDLSAVKGTFVPQSDHRSVPVSIREPRLTVMIALDRRMKTIWTQIGSSMHANMCAGVAAGHDIGGGLGNGVAPSASLVAAAYYLTDPVVNPATVVPCYPPYGNALRLFRRTDVDLISDSTSIESSRGSFVDDRQVEWQLHERAYAKYPKLTLSGAGNEGPSARFWFGAELSERNITVGGYLPDETWAANIGITPEQHTAAPFSSYGPAGDGALKPDLLALTGTLTSARESAIDDLFQARRQGPILRLPEGTMVADGTSSAGPSLAGHVALLISAAKQAGVPYDADRLQMALFATAKYLDGIEARVQGRGLVQVAKAWDALQRIRAYELSRFKVRAPVRTEDSAFFKVPHTGRGLYERIGWAPNQQGMREIVIKRTSGPPGRQRYRLQWKGDTAAFTSPVSELVLPLGQDVKVPIRIAVGESRAYSAILDLVDPSMDMAAYSTMCTVIVAEQLTEANGFHASVSRVAPRPGHGIVFANVPLGTTALRIRVNQRGGEFVSLRALTPDGQIPKTVGVSSGDGRISEQLWRTVPSGRETYDHTFVNPPAGVWQFWVTHDDGWWPRGYRLPAKQRPIRAQFTMDMTAARVEMSVNANLGDSNGAGTLTVRNRGGTLGGAQVVGLGVGAAREAMIAVKPDFEPVFYDLNIAAGTIEITAEADGGPADDAHVSLMMFLMDGQEARLVAQDVGAGTRKQVVVRSPKAGRYRIGVDAWGNISRDGLAVRYRDVIYHPEFGQTLVHDIEAPLFAGSTRMLDVSWETQRPPLDGRQWVGYVGLLATGYAAMESDWRNFWWTLPASAEPAWSSKTAKAPVATRTVWKNRGTKK